MDSNFYFLRGRPPPPLRVDSLNGWPLPGDLHVYMFIYLISLFTSASTVHMNLGKMLVFMKNVSFHSRISNHGCWI